MPPTDVAPGGRPRLPADGPRGRLSRLRSRGPPRAHREGVSAASRRTDDRQVGRRRRLADGFCDHAVALLLEGFVADLVGPDAGVDGLAELSPVPGGRLAWV